jgi:hypothetical protein
VFRQELTVPTTIYRVYLSEVDTPFSDKLNHSHNRDNPLHFRREELLRRGHEQAECYPSQHNPVRPLDEITGHVAWLEEPVVDAAEKGGHPKKQEHAAEIPCGGEPILRYSADPASEKQNLTGQQQVGNRGNSLGSHGLQ